MRRPTPPSIERGSLGHRVHDSCSVLLVARSLFWPQYYQYFDIDDPPSFCDAHRGLCERLELVGRVRIASEGVNGTCAGSRAAVAEYISTLRSSHAAFAATDFKISACPDDLTCFNGLQCKVRRALFLVVV